MRSPLLLSFPALTALTALVALSPAATTTAQAQTIYNDVASFNAAAAGNTLYTFEGIAPSRNLAINPDLAPLTFSVTGGANQTIYAASATNVGDFSLNGTDSIVAGINSVISDNPATTRIDLGGVGESFSAFAAEIGQSGNVINQYRISLYLGDNQVGTTYTSDSRTLSGTFIGFVSALPFDNVRLTALVSRGRSNVFDNVRTLAAPSSAAEAPEPGSLALLLPVAGMAGIVIRKRRGNR